RQPITFDKLGTGDYLVKGSLGFAQEGWYIEVPKDANGNTVVAVEYSTLENGDLSIKTYKRKFDFELAAVVADLEIPTDIPEGRWIDIRLHEEIVLEETLPDDIEQ
ncbi:phage tail protein, partial [Acinetobacter baumannii]